MHVSGSSPPTLERKISLGFSRMDWSFNERSDPHFVAKPEQVVVEEGECALIDVTADGTLPIGEFHCARSYNQNARWFISDRVSARSSLIDESMTCFLSSGHRHPCPS